MTKLFRLLPRLGTASIQRASRRLAGGAAAVCMAASLLTGNASAQLIENYPMNSPSADSLLVRGQSPEPMRIARRSDMQPPAIGAAIPGQGVVVGQGGPTNINQVPSVIGGPAPGAPAGPYVQTQPLYNDNGYEIPCPCDEGCDFGWYVSAEALYFRRENDERFSLSQTSRMPAFDYEWGGRLTLGRMLDCVTSWEAVYAGPFNWERTRTATGAGNLQSKLIPFDGYTAASIDTFNNANQHIQTQQARLQSFEVNQRRWSWDVLSALFGIRVIDYRENYALQSSSLAGEGLLFNGTRNIMIGPQIGGDIRTPLGLRGLIGVKGKAGLLANFNRGESFVRNDGVNLIDAVDNDVDVAGIGELGIFGVYSVTRSVRLNAGYEGWYLAGVATTAGQDPNRISPGTGVKVFATDDVFAHGASFGAEILY